MFPDYIPNDLIMYWVFFIFLSVLPMILAFVTQKIADKRSINKSTNVREEK